LAPDINSDIGKVKKAAYLQKSDEVETPTSGELYLDDEKINLKQFEKFQGGESGQIDPVDSMSIWREWLGK
jgi:hypothetical protein